MRLKEAMLVEELNAARAAAHLAEGKLAEQRSSLADDASKSVELQVCVCRFFLSLRQRQLWMPQRLRLRRRRSAQSGLKPSTRGCVRRWKLSVRKVRASGPRLSQ